MATGSDCRILRGGEYEGQQGLTLSRGVSAQSAGAEGLCLHTLTIAPGQQARAHRHAAHESAIYLVSGVVDVWWGEDLSHHDIVRPGDFIYIPAGVPHLPVNRGTEPVFAVVARTDPNEQESLELLPQLDAIPGNGPDIQSG